MPKLSVILPVYNGGATLARALASIAEQTHPADEVVVINDGSTDNTGEVIAEWSDKLPIVTVENKPNAGLTVSLQRGAERATGDLLCRLDADDLWLPDHLESLVACKEAMPEAVLIAGRAELRPEDGGAPMGESAPADDTDVRIKLLWDNPIVHSAVGIDKAAYTRVGGYIGPTYAEDYDLWIRLLKTGRFASTGKVSVGYYVSTTSVSRIKRQSALSIRLGLQRQAIRAFAGRHPWPAARVMPIVLLRQIANRFGLA